MPTLTAAIEDAAEAARSVQFFDQRSVTSQRNWGSIHEDARATATRLQAYGVGPDHNVALLGPNSPEMVTAIQAAWLTGAAVSLIPLPRRIQALDVLVERMQAQVRNVGAVVCLVDPGIAAVFPVDALPCRTVDLPAATAPGPTRATRLEDHGPVDDSLPAVLQLTSGSVQDPRVVVVPRSHVVRNMLAIQERSLISAEDDLLLSWLPLFHDMGLLGFMVLPMITGTALALASPEAFLARPSMWMEAVGSFRASITGAPCFAYGVAARSLGGSVDLSPLRLAFNGAEPIDPATVEQFTTTAQPAALDPRAMYCVYGLAEATLAVTLPEPGVGMHVDHLDATALERDGVAVPADASTDQTRLLARLGTPIRHCEVRIADPSDGRVLGGGAAGEVQLRGGSVTPGYYRDDAGSTAAMVDGWFRTGDIGYWADDELVICGRIKEIIIVGGRNIFPEHVEREVECIKGVRLGNSVAFSIEDGRGREGIAVVAEVSARATDTAALRTLIVERVRAVVDVPPADVLLVAPGQLPKTPSGKRQRAACRTQYLEGRFEPA